MGSKIDRQMQQIYSDCVNNGGLSAQKVSQPEAIKLITRAETLNTSYTSSFCSSSKRGNKYLKKLVSENPTNFTPEGRDTINSYLSTGRMPTSMQMPSGLNQAYNDSDESSSMGRAGGGMRANMPPTGMVAPNVNLPMGGPTMPLPRPPVVAVNPNPNGAFVNRPPVNMPAPMGPMNPVNPTMGGAGALNVPMGGNLGPNVSPRPAVPNANASPVMRGVPTPIIPTTPTTPTTPTINPTTMGVSASVTAPSTGPVAPTVAPTIAPTINPTTTPVVNSPVGGTSANNPPVTSVIPPSVQPIVPNSSVGSGIVGVHGKEILNFQAAKRTWACHWYPVQETKPGGDPMNNLYAEGGALAKLDMVTGGKAKDYEFTQNRKTKGDGSQYGWWGHCNNASEAACVLQAPKHDVIMKALNGTDVIFTRSNIQGLLVKVTPSLVNNVDFKGERYNSPSNNLNDPKPEFFLQTLTEWAKDGLPFVMDIDRGPRVWNFPYDQAKVYESDKAPNGFSGNLPEDGSVKYYHIEMAGTGFDAKKRSYECYIQRDGSGGVVSSAWIKTENTHNNPDFLWRPHPKGDIMNKAMWVQNSKVSNPNVDFQVVYDIYTRSLA